MTSKANIMDSIKPLSQLRSNPFVTLSSVARQPVRKVVRSDSESSVQSTATETTQVMKFVRFSEETHIRKTLSREDYTLEETKATWSSRGERKREEIKKIDAIEDLKDVMLLALVLLLSTHLGISLLGCLSPWTTLQIQG
jgi:hypothetical protein